MRHLKSFNESIQKPRFELVDKDDASRLSIERGLDKFSTGEIKYLSKLFKYPDLWKRTFASGSTISFGTSKILNKCSSEVYISKYSDDWYIMCIKPRKTYKEYYFIIDTRQGFKEMMDGINNMDLV